MALRFRLGVTTFAAIMLIGGPAAVIATAQPPAATPSSQPAKPTELRAEPEKSVTVTSATEAVWNFGRRKVAPGDEITHVFTVRNAGKEAVTIDTLPTSCHCTSATLVGPGAPKSGDPPFRLLPGKTVGIKVAINVDEAHAVDFRKMVWVYVEGKDEAVLTLTAAGTFVENTAN